MVARKIAESLYDGLCDVYEYRGVLKPNKSTEFGEVLVHSQIPCRMSHKTINTVDQKVDGGASLVQVVELILSPDVEIKAGSKIVVTQNGKTTEYSVSGEPAIYHTHQQIVMEIFKGWA